MLPEAQHPSCSAEGKETEAGDNLGSPCEVGAPFMLIEPIDDQAIPSRRGEVGARKIRGSATHEEPGTPLRKQQRQEHDGKPGNRLPDSSGRDEGFTIGKPL